MSITSALILPAAVILVPVRELSPDVRAQLPCNDEDFAITRPRSRTPSRIVDREAAAFLQEFRTPKTIVEAVISFSRTAGTDPEEVLTAAYPMIQRFLAGRLLEQAHSREATEIVSSLGVGAELAGYEILRSVQLLDDCEVHQARNRSGQTVALKVSRLHRGRDMQRKMDREARILKRLDGSVNPKLIDEGMLRDRSYLVIEWCEGVSATAAAEEMRRRSGPNIRQDLLNLVSSILQAYSRLHFQDVVHGDVHPRNVLVDSTGRVKIIDYGLARWTNDPDAHVERGGVGVFFEPEYARARLTKTAPPQASVAGEEYALAALAYYLLTGNHYLDFSVERREMLRQIAVEEPLTFAARGCEPWPVVERTLARALRKKPTDRFSSVFEFTSELRAPLIPDRTRSLVRRDVFAAQLLLQRVLQRVATLENLGSDVALSPPTCSVAYGAAGVAYALYRIACIRSEPALLSIADVWSTKAIHDQGQSAAFYNAELGVDAETVGPVSIYHTAAGIYCVQALISHAMGDLVSQHHALDAFMSRSEAPYRNLDLTLGRSGTLLACSLLLETASDAQPLQAFGEQIAVDISSELSQYGPILEHSQFRFMGIAHGWAGVLYSMMRWCQVCGRRPSSALEERLQQLAGCAEPYGRGIRWKHKTHEARPHYMPGWCNGTAGFIHLWTLAHDLFHSPAFLELADRAAWNVWEEPQEIANLCCGLTGRAYALLNLYRHTGEAVWLNRAEDLANSAARDIEASGIRNSLYKGDLGVAVLAADLERPDRSCMPLFEREG